MNASPMGPGFFIFFEQYESNVTKKQRIIYTPKRNDDKEVMEIIQVIFSFLEK
jgi:hypothetical protein